MLETVEAAIVVPALTFTFIVPGDQRWTVRTVCAVASTDNGGTPDRAFTLTVTDGTNPVAVAGALDSDTDPATVTVTWANSAQAVVSAGADGFSVAPFPNLILNPGYVITGEITNPAPADTWESAVCWFDFVYTGNASDRGR